MAFDKQNFSNSTTNIMAMAMQDDARDTLEKVTEAYSTLAPLIGMSVGDTLDDEDLQGIIEYIGPGLTLLLEDGDCVSLRVADGNVIASSSGKNGDDVIDEIIVNSDGTLIIDEVRDLSRQYSWSLNEVLTSLAHQAQSATIFSRLSGVCAKQEVTQSDIMACFSDLTSTLTPDVQSLRSNLLNLGANLSSVSVLTMLQSSFTAVDSATSVDNSITFADNDFSVSAYCGTVVKQMFTTAASVLGQILLVNGGIIGKIAGIVLTGIGLVGNAISTAANAMASTRAIYNPDASQYEYAQRLFKGRVSPSYVNEYIKSRIAKDRICLVRYPAFNLYLWENPGEQDYYYEAYASMMVNDIPSYTNGDVVNTMYFTTTTGSGSMLRKQLRVAMDAYAPGSSGRGFYPFIEAADYFGNGAGTYAQWLEIPTDDEIRRRVTLSVAVAAFQFLNLRRYSAGDVANYLNDGFVVIESNDADQPENGLWEVLWNYFVRGKVPSWGAIVNKVIPEFQAWHDAIPNTPLGLGLFAGTGANGVVSLDGALSSCPSFRNSYLVTPPEYTPSAVIGAVAITLGAAAALTAAYFVGKSIAKKVLTKQATKRYGRVQTKLQEWQNADPENKEAALNSYLKEVKRYNKFATLTGVSSINAVDGWLSSGSSSVQQTSNSSISTLIELLNKYQEINSNSLGAVSLLITGE